LQKGSCQRSGTPITPSSAELALTERRAALIGELELLSLQLPVRASDDQDRVDAAALRADITKLITAITIGLSDAD
jgi:hypothetical protein